MRFRLMNYNGNPNLKWKKFPLDVKGDLIEDKSGRTLAKVKLSELFSGGSGEVSMYFRPGKDCKIILRMV